MSKRILSNIRLDDHYMFTHGKKSKAFISDVFYDESQKQAKYPKVECGDRLKFFSPSLNITEFELVDIRCVRFQELTTEDMMALGVWEEDGAWYNGVKVDDHRYMKHTAYNSLSAAFAELINILRMNMGLINNGYVYIGTFKEVQTNERKEQSNESESTESAVGGVEGVQ